MNTRRIIPIILDQEITARRVIVGDALSRPDSSQVMNLYYGTQILFRCTIYSGNIQTAYNPSADATWLFGIDNAFTADKPDLVVSLDDQFNISGDWDDLAPVAGKIAFRADLATTELKAALAELSSATQSQPMYAYLWMFPPGGGDVLIGTWELNMYRIAVDPVTAAPATAVTHITPEQANASYVPRWGDQARWRWQDGGWQYLFDEDAQWRGLVPRLVDGEPTLAFTDPIS